MSRIVKLKLKTIAEAFNLDFAGDGEIEIQGLCGLSDNLPDKLSFVADDKLSSEAEASSIPAFVVKPGKSIPGKGNIFHDNPNYAISRIATLFHSSHLTFDGPIHSTAVIHETAQLGAGVRVGPNTVIGADVAIGDNCTIYANVVIMDRTQIGTNCLIHPQVVIREDCVIGDNVIIQPGASIGGDGYGFVYHNDQHVKTPQLGNVIIESNVEIGANCAIDRGRFTATKIGAGTKVDNLVMIAHNVQVGNNCLLVSQSGISGSTVLGNDVTLAGQVGLVGHITIGDGVTLLGQSMATKDIKQPGLWAGSPARPAALWRKAVAGMYANLNKKQDSE
ncbi:MAG: UDP-3-O-(3-hydroxymyristoyl)glucosamine N-acyltransferase [Gammaproteobacteria bacterium]